MVIGCITDGLNIKLLFWYSSHGLNNKVRSLHNIIFNSFRLVLVLWRLLHWGFLFLSYVIIVVQKRFLWRLNNLLL